MQDQIELAILLQKINMKREEMITIAMETGFTSKETITCSQELDQLIIQYQTYKMVENRVGVCRTFLQTISLLMMKPSVSLNRMK
ncbi:aspartyl-phosphate phosphatase Spo0E family protein [Bacillus sp. AK128]